MNDVTTDFQAAMGDAGIPGAELPVADGQLHRFHVDGDSAGTRNGWYVLYSDGLSAGAFGSWKDGETHTWCEKRDESLTNSERAELRRQMDAIRAERERQRAEEAASAREQAQMQWDAATVADEHPYLAAKSAHAYGIRVNSSGQLVVPLRDTDGVIHSLQTISPEGRKLFLRGGAITGHYHSIGKPEGTIYICEGYATGATIHGAADAVAVAFNAGNLLPVAQAIRKKYPSISLVIAADNDQWTDGNPGVDKAAAAARTVNAKIAIPRFKDTSSKPTDFNDLALLEGAVVVRSQLQAAEKPEARVKADTAEVLKHSPEEHQRKLIEDLAALPPMEHDQRRNQIAKELGIRVTVLDAEVAKVRGETSEDVAQGTRLVFDEPDPWPEEIDGTALLQKLAEVCARYVVLPSHAPEALALWIVHTFVHDAASVSPYLDIHSPQKRCGKTTLVGVLVRLVARAIPASNISPAALFRMVEAKQPTLLIDEADTFLRTSDELRGILNSGHTRSTAFVIRTVGEDNEPRQFSTWAPKVIALIGELPDTIADRSIRIVMQRKHSTEKVERLPPDGTPQMREIKRRCERWAADNLTALKNIDSEPPVELHDRAADNWRPLLAIAEIAGGEWPEKACRAALALSQGDDSDDSAGVMLLSDIREILGTKDRVTSEHLVAELVKKEERPWPEWKQGKAITTRQVARLLKPFKVKPKSLRIDDLKVVRGYEREDFQEIFSRYLSTEKPSEAGNPPFSSATPLQPSNHAGSSDFPSATAENRVADRIPRKPAARQACSSVADRIPLNGGNKDIDAQKKAEGSATTATSTNGKSSDEEWSEADIEEDRREREAIQAEDRDVVAL